MGYMIASLSNQPDFGASINYFVSFSMLGISALGMAILLINQWAIQDGNLYIAVNGAQNILSAIPGWRRQYTVIGLGLIAAAMTFVLPNLTDTFIIVTGIGSTTVPVASTIMAMDLFVLPRLFGIRRPTYRVANWSELGFANWPGVIALLLGAGVGLYTANLIPFVQTEYVGFPALQAWVVGAVTYLVLVAVVARQRNAKAILGFSAIEEAAATA